MQAGFGPEDAQTIAFASQYVDDATEHKPIRIEGIPAAAAAMARSSPPP
jgi:hypothetical protein